MNLPILQSEVKTMSSREIATLCEKEHKHVKRDIEVMLSQINLDATKFGHIYLDSMNRQQTEYLLDKDLTLTLVSGYSATLRYRIIKRWQELESSQSLALPNFTDPAEAAEAWAKEYREKQALAITLEQAQPKINHYDKVVERKNLLNATQVGEKLDGMSAIILNRHLAELGVYNKSVKRGKVFSTWFIQKGYGEMKQSDAGFDQALFTQKGQAWVIEQLTSEGVV